MISLTPHQLKALNYRSHTSLTANAGSGKTFVLSKRYLEIAINENISLRNIAAITFTDKAAGELYKKIADQIEDRINTSGDEKLLKKLENLRSQLVSANISTIHSFCIDILKENPVEAGIDADFIPVDEQISNELIELAVEEVIKKSLQKNEDEKRLKYLIRTFSSKSLFAKELKSLIKNRKSVLTLYDNIYKYPEEKIAGIFHSKFLETASNVLFGSSAEEKKLNIISAAVKINNDVLSGKPHNQTASNAEKILQHLSRENEIENVLMLFDDLKNEICTRNTTIKKAGYLKNNEGLVNECLFVENFFKELNYFTLNKDHHEIELELAHFGKELTFFFIKTLQLYNEKKKENGYLDFEDILLISHELLKKDNIRKALSEKFQYIMIDEYQDTNEIQYQIFLPILDYLKKGNLFVVGDEKQSIYMFRDAELEVFFQTKREIEKTSGNENILSLPESFRMAPNLCAFTNYLFRNLFSISSSLVLHKTNLFNEVEHSDLICARDDNFPGNVEILLSEDSEENNPGENSEAELIAGRILNLINKNEEGRELKWSDVAILSRKRKNFSGLEKVFVKYSIPFSIVGGKGFYQKQIVYDVFNYFSFLLDTNNNTAFAGILRSPFFSISDSEIFEISLEKGENFWNKFRNYSEKNIEYKKAAGTISENLSLVNNIEISILLRKILNESDMLAVLASQPNGLQEIANIEKLIKLTIKFSSKGFNTLYDYIDFLKDSIERTEDEAQAALAEESNLNDSGSVKIMTLHQSKGLEFPAVFLFKCNDRSKTDAVRSKMVSADKNFGLLSKIPVNENYFSEYKSAPVIGAANYISSKKNIAELKRLFYVGITRAKDYLFISAENKENYPKDSFMGLLAGVFDTNSGQSSFTLKDNLKFLVRSGNEYSNIKKEISFTIPVIKKIDEFPEIFEDKTANEIKEKILIDEIKDKTENEIISATKVSVFKQCPLKYQLTYEYGFSPLFNQYKNWQHINPEKTHFEFSDKEENNTASDSAAQNDEVNSRAFSNASAADIKGRIIHSILQNEISADQIDDFTAKQLKGEIELLQRQDEFLSGLKAEIVDDLKKFYVSRNFLELNKKINYKNEFEIYVKENDYFLYGIIDKIIFDNKKIIIADYKTDNIAKNEIPARVRVYINQLKFYSYIAVNLFPDFDIIELRLLFVKHPDEFISEALNKQDIMNFGSGIKTLVNEIRNKNFPKNLKHCKECYFAIEGECIKN